MAKCVAIAILLFNSITVLLLCACAESTSIQCASGLTDNSNGVCASAGYGQPCNSTAPCDEGAFLSCNGGTCGCQNPQNSDFDPNDGVCKLKLNEACNVTATGGSLVMPCQQFAFCSQFSGAFKCECDKNYVESKGKCFLPYSGQCNEGNASIPVCNAGGYMECVQTDPLEEGYCRCKANSNTTWYEAETKSCVLLEGSECVVGNGAQACVEKAVCKEKTVGKNDLICTCAEDLKPDPTTKQCVAYYDEDCSSATGATCKPESFLSCEIEGRCDCDPSNPDIQYDSNTRTCALRPGGKCDGGEKYSCVTHSQCNSTGFCDCIQPLAPGRYGDCYLPYGENCNYVPTGRWTCDNLGAHHYCNSLSRTCSCSATTAHYEDGVCKQLAGKTCTLGSDYYECVKNAECIGSEFGNDYCACKGPEYAANLKRMCVKGYNATCDAQNDCNVDKRQKCTNGRCACADPATLAYEEKKGECNLIFNAACSAEVGSTPCHSPLVCGAESQKCECNGTAGLVPDGLGSCVKTIGTSCNPFSSNPTVECDPRAYLICNEYSDCGCRNDSWNNNGTCQLLVKQSCVSGQPCSDTSFCNTSTSTCDCSPDHAASLNLKKCLNNLDEPCTLDDDCNYKDHFLRCRENGKCGCTGYSVLIGGVCKLRVGFYCLDGQECSDFSVCDANGTHFCECDTANHYKQKEREGFKVCLGTLNATCATAEDCDARYELLVCQDRKCACAQDFNYDDSTSKCKSSGADKIGINLLFIITIVLMTKLHLKVIT